MSIRLTMLILAFPLAAGVRFGLKDKVSDEVLYGLTLLILAACIVPYAWARQRAEDRRHGDDQGIGK